MPFIYVAGVGRSQALTAQGATPGSQLTGRYAVLHVPTSIDSEYQLGFLGEND